MCIRDSYYIGLIDYNQKAYESAARHLDKVLEQIRQHNLSLIHIFLSQAVNRGLNLSFILQLISLKQMFRL